MAEERWVEARLATEVLVLGAGWSAVCAALEARAAGRSVLLAAPGTALADELTVALQGDLGEVGDPHLAAIRNRMASLGGLREGWLDPPIGELTVDRLLAEQGIDLLLYAVPLALVEHDGEVAGAILAGKDGPYAIAAGAVVDATADGALFAASGVAFTAPERITARRSLYFQFAGEDLGGLPEQVAAFRLSAQPTWPGEVCLQMTGEAAYDGTPVPAALHQQARLAVPAVSEAVIAAVPGLREAVLSHSGHRLLPLNGRSLDVAEARHPRLPNAYGAGAWVHGLGFADPDALAASGTRAGRLAAENVRAVFGAKVRLPEPVQRTVEVAVVGGGTGGAIAGLAAGRQGAGTTVIEAGWFLGGIGTGGGIHMYYHGVRGGLQDEVDEQVRELADRIGGVAKVAGFSPEAKKVALEAALADAGVTVLYGTTVMDVEVQGGRLTALLLASPGRLERLEVKATVDATGDGDVAARAGAPYQMGRARDGLNHAFSQSCGLFRQGKVAFSNFDAGFVDATDVVDLTRARRHGLQLYWREDGFSPDDRMLYIAPLLGLRQSRHVLGDYQITLADQAGGQSFEDDVAYGACHYDNHAFDYENESDEAALWCWLLGHWHRQMRHGVPYRALLPQQVEGLVMGCRALAVTHDAHMLFRMQRDMQRVGEAAGTAAALAARLGVTPRQLAFADLRQALTATGAIKADWDSRLPAGSPEELVAQLGTEESHVSVWQLYQHGELAVPSLRAALQGEAAEPRWWAAVILAMLGYEEAQPELLAALERRDETRPHDAHVKTVEPWMLRYSAPRWLAAIPLLGRIGDHRAVAALGRVLAGPLDNPDATIAAVRALGTIGDPTAVPALQALLERSDLPGAAAMQDSLVQTGRSKAERDTVWQLHLATAEALQRLGVPAAEVIEPFLSDPRGFVRNYAERLLDELPGSRAGAAESTVRVSPR